MNKNLENDPDQLRALLRWYADAGVDEAVSAEPGNMFKWTPARSAAPATAKPNRQPSTKPPNPRSDTPPSTPVFSAEKTIAADEAIALAKSTANTCATVEALAEAVSSFIGCPLKSGARNTVFADGVYGADLLVIGEAPGRDEDRLGKPFVGRAGQLLDKMLASIGRSRQTDTLISNVIYWRPPGNRTPTPVETAICRPFVDRLISLTQPKAILLAGGAPMAALLGVSGIMRARGQWKAIEIDDVSYPALPTFHPAFLLRQPGQKRLAWRDLLSLEEKLRDA